MYIQKAEIKNIRSIIDFEIEFENPAGWHVLIGDNGAGKSTIIRSLALALVGDIEAGGLRGNWDDWLNKREKKGEIGLSTLYIAELDRLSRFNVESDISFSYKLGFLRTGGSADVALSQASEFLPSEQLHAVIRAGITSWDFNNFYFSVAYGPYRRFKGGSSEWDEVYRTPSLQRLAAHLSVFDESVALTEPISWLQDLNYKDLEGSKESRFTLENLKKFINSKDFLPHNTKLDRINSENVFFEDGNETIITLNQMSDGYRSVLSMTFELIRQLVRVYGPELVFKNIEKSEMFIDLPGVVLIDEIDAHLHPTWQTRIGQWFLKYFPKLQFIVTTHSPLVCRAAENGSIWRLKAPGSEGESGEITGLNRDRLIHGNILDAYGTEVFGENVSISEDSNDMLNRLAELNVKSMMGEIEEAEHAELENLKAVLPTESNL